MKHDALGSRLKAKYEDVYRISIPQNTYAIVRIDGKAFHTFTKGLERPQCKPLGDSMDTAAMALARQMMGTQFAYGQSDEYSFLITDFATEESEMWFNGNIQKIASVSASIFTAYFNEAWQKTGLKPGIATFDSRVFVIPRRPEVENYFIWRQLDATRNSLSMLASCHFSHKELQSKKAADKHELLHSKGINWNDYPTDFKRGRVIMRKLTNRVVRYTHNKTKEEIVKPVEEMTWTVDNEIPVFPRDRSYLDSLIPA